MGLDYYCHKYTDSRLVAAKFAILEHTNFTTKTRSFIDHKHCFHEFECLNYQQQFFAMFNEAAEMDLMISHPRLSELDWQIELDLN